MRCFFDDWKIDALEGRGDRRPRFQLILYERLEFKEQTEWCLYRIEADE